MNGINAKKLSDVIEALEYFIENDKFPDDTCAADLAHYLKEIEDSENS